MSNRRSFATKIASGNEFQNKLKMFSLNDSQAEARLNTYLNVINQTMDVNSSVSGRKGYAGASVSAANLEGSTIYGAVLKSYVNSIAPIFAVQREMDTPKQQLMYVDAYGLYDGGDTPIVPNVGPDREWLRRSWDNKQVSPTEEVIADPATPLKQLSTSPILPGSFYAEVYDDNKKLVGTITDDGKGNFLASDGMLNPEYHVSNVGTGPATADNINTVIYDGYENGASLIRLNFGSRVKANFTIRYSVIFDVTAERKVERAYFKADYYDMRTEALLVPVERNVVTDHAMSKQGILNSDEMYANFIESEYTKAVNNLTFATLLGGYTGPTWSIDVSQYSLAAGMVESLAWALKSAFVQAENALAQQTYKEAKITGMLVDHKMADLLNMLFADQGWVRNTARSYYKDIVGWLDEAPAVLCDYDKLRDGVADDECVALVTTRTTDGQLAPLFHGIFLAPTDLPVVANYGGITQYTGGLYSMEGMGFTTSEFALRLKFKMPQGLMISK